MLKGVGIWKTIDIPRRADVVGSKRIFWATKDPAASLVCCEDRLVVPFNIFAPDMRLSSIRVVLVAGAAWDYYISQIDIEGAYPNEILTADETTPPGLSIPSPFGKIFADDPHATFYGLEKPKRWWYQWSVGSMTGDIGFRRDDEDQVAPLQTGEGRKRKGRC